MHLKSLSSDLVGIFNNLVIIKVDLAEVGSMKTKTLLLSKTPDGWYFEEWQSVMTNRSEHSSPQINFQ